MCACVCVCVCVRVLVCVFTQKNSGMQNDVLRFFNSHQLVVLRNLDFPNTIFHLQFFFFIVKILLSNNINNYNFRELY